ncbi:putative secreted protein [Klebsiella phage Muenster]|nr:putative secreted protein [Klebsiella phage Muenster]
MKLYFLFSFAEDMYGFAEVAESDGISSHTRHQKHPHEFYNNLFMFMQYKIFSSEFDNLDHPWELPLIDIPDEYVFQFMLMGLEDYDLVVYNYRTKRIMLGTHDSSIVYVSSTNDELASDEGNYRKSYGYIENDNDFILDFRVSEEERRKRETYQVELKPDNGYNEILEVLKPYYLDIVYKKYKRLLNHLSEKEPIGFETNSLRNSIIFPPRVMKYGEVSKHKMKLYPDDIEVLYHSWLNNDELYVENKKLMRISNNDDRLLQAWYNDSYSAFTDSNSEYWKNTGQN